MIQIVLNKDGVVLNINNAGAIMHGMEKNEIIGRKFIEFVPETERRTTFDAFLRAYKSAETTKENLVAVDEQIVKLMNPGGTPRYLRIIPKVIKILEEGVMTGIMHTGLDVTENQILKEELHRHQRQLQRIIEKKTEEIQTFQDEMLRGERLATLGRLTSTVSNEIRNPLGTISSSLYIVSERTEGMDFGIDMPIKRGARAVRRCDGIIEQMLDFTSTKGLEKRIIDFTSWIEKILADIKKPENVSIHSRIEPRLSAAVDHRRLHRCISNVFENAFEALQETGDGLILADAAISRGRLNISITDNGPGIPGKIRDRVFDPLYSTKQNGIGMGLPVCKQVMELHGGSIRIRSGSDGGTCVILSLPAPEQEDGSGLKVWNGEN
jgi:PAS domain S-box-containing protein